VLRFVFFSFLFAFLFALSIGRRVALLELTNLDGDRVALDTQTDGQFGVASLYLGGSIQGLVGIISSEGGGHFVAFRLTSEAVLLAALQFAFEIVSGRFAFQSDDVAIAVARILIDRHAVLEREFLLGFGFGAGRRGRRR